MLNFIFAFIAFVCVTINISYASSDITQQNIGQNIGVTPLISSATFGDVNGVSFFVNKENVNDVNIGGASALHLAARNKNLDIAKILIENGADVNIQDNEGWTPLMRASAAFDYDIVKLLIDSNARIDILNKFQESALLHASMSSCYDCIYVILSASNKVKKGNVLIDQINQSIEVSNNKNNKEISKLLTDFISIYKNPSIEKNLSDKDISSEVKTYNQFKLKSNSKSDIELSDQAKFKLKNNSQKSSDKVEEININKEINDQQNGIETNISKKKFKLKSKGNKKNFKLKHESSLNVIGNSFQVENPTFKLNKENINSSFSSESDRSSPIAIIKKNDLNNYSSESLAENKIKTELKNINDNNLDGKFNLKKYEEPASVKYNNNGYKVLRK